MKWKWTCKICGNMSNWFWSRECSWCRWDKKQGEKIMKLKAEGRESND